MVNSPKGSHKDEAESSSTKGKTGAPVLRPLPAPSTLPKLGGVHYPGAIASDRDEDGQRTIISATPVVAVAHAAQPPEAPATAFEGTNEVFIQSKVFETLHDETGKAVVKPGNVFEGTNEVYIQSRVFETLHDETGKAVIKPGNVFEGTNEIFIQSKVFDALGDDAKSDETKAGTPSSKLAAKRTSLTRSDAPADKPTVKRASFSKLAPVEKNTTKRTNPNEPDKTVDKPSLKSAVLGVRVSSLLPRANADKGVPDSMLIELQNSGILPNVDFDKSLDLDLSALDGLEGTLETTPSTELPLPSALAKAAPETSSSAQAAPSPSEVFVSKIRDKAASRPLPKAASASLVTATKPKPTDAHAGLHPDDCPTASTSPHAAYPIVHLFETCQRTILDNTIPFAGHQKSLATLMEHILDASVLPEPKFIQLMGDCPWDRERFTVHFLEQCYRQITNCTIYSTVKNTRREPVHHCFASLLSSRIGITQDDPDDIKTERILKSAETLVSEGQTVWALNTMLAYYGLRALLSGNKNYDHLLDHPEQLETQISEVCLSAIAESASHGMVIVVITELGTHRYNAWREVVGAIRQRCMRNVVVILLTNDALCQEFDCLTPLQLSPLNHQDMLTIARQSMSEFKIPPPAFLEKLAKKSHGSLSQFACIAKLLKQHGTLKFEHYHHCIDTKDGFLDSLPETYADLALMHFNALSEDQRYFMSVASLIGSPFNLDDISAILSLQALPDEIPWFHNLRKPWSKRVVEELVKLGEIRPILDRDHQVCGYGIVDELAARQIAKTLDPDFLQAVHGCFARYLERLRPGDPQIARQYDAAGLWEQAVKHWLVIARERSAAFFNISTLRLLNYCLQQTAPHHGAVFIELQSELAKLASRFGQYDAAQEHFEAMLRLSQLAGDPLQSIRAFTGVAHALLMRGRYETARDLLLFGLDLAESHQASDLIADCYHGLAQIVFFSGGKGALVNALRYAEKALELRREAGKLESIAQTLNLIAKIYLVRGDLKRAHSAVSEAYYAQKASGHWFDRPDALCTMAFLAHEKNAYDEAMAHLREGLETVRITGNVAHRFALLSVRVFIHIERNRRQEVRDDLAGIETIIQEHAFLPWVTLHHILVATFDFSRKNFQKTTRALRVFFDSATELRNNYLLSLGYRLSASLNFEVYQRDLGKVSLEKTERLFASATTMFESIGAWHDVAESQRQYAAFLTAQGREPEAQKCLERAEKVDPYCQ